MEFEVKNEPTDDGAVAYVSAAEARFSFLVGKGKLRVAMPPGAYIWLVERDGVKFMIQLVVTPVPQNIATAELKAEQVLADHRRCEVDYQVGIRQQKSLEETLGLWRFPTGEPFFVWCMEMQSVGEEMSPIIAYATTLHAGHIIMHTVQGIGPGWDWDRLRLKILRVVISTFRNS